MAKEILHEIFKDGKKIDSFIEEIDVPVDKTADETVKTADETVISLVSKMTPEAIEQLKQILK